MIPARLPVTERRLTKLAHGGIDMSRFDLCLIQHLRADTAHFVRMLNELGFRVRRIVAIEYSTEPEARASLEEAGIIVDEPTLAELEGLAGELLRSEREVIVCEVGGYCARSLTRSEAPWIGVIEETRRGLTRYQQVANTSVPIMQLAISRLKLVEAVYVGDAVSRGIASSLLELGLGLRGLRTAVVGVGAIGKAVAESLARSGATVMCYDTDSVQILRAVTEGLGAAPRSRLLSSADVIVGATGNATLTVADLEMLVDKVVLVSASSAQIEFPVNELRIVARRSQHVGAAIEEFELPWGKRLYLLNQGFPINFRTGSLPLAIGDLLFAQVAAALAVLLSTDRPRGGIYGLSQAEEASIAADWLEQYQPNLWRAAKE